MKGHFLYYLRAALWLTEVTRGCSRKNFLISLSERSICVLKACNSGRLKWGVLRNLLCLRNKQYRLLLSILLPHDLDKPTLLVDVLPLQAADYRGAYPGVEDLPEDRDSPDHPAGTIASRLSPLPVPLGLCSTTPMTVLFSNRSKKRFLSLRRIDGLSHSATAQPRSAASSVASAPRRACPS